MASQYFVSCSMLHNILSEARDGIFHFFSFSYKIIQKGQLCFSKNVLLKIKTSNLVGVETQLNRIPLWSWGQKAI